MRRNARLRGLALRLLPYTAFLPPLLAMSFLALRYGFTLPSVEQLQFVPVLRAAYLDHSLSWHDLFWQQPTSDHITLFPLLLLLAWAPLTHWNVAAELLATPVIVTASAAILCAFARRLGGFDEPWRKAALAFTAGLLLCSPQSWAAWVWTMNMLFPGIPLLCLLAILLLVRSRPGSAAAYWSAAALCFAATFSFGHGIVTWIGCLPLVLADIGQPRGRAKAAGWLCMAATCAAIFATHHASPGVIDPLPRNWRDAMVLVSHFFSVLWGGPLTIHVHAALPLGRLALAMGAVSFFMLPRRERFGRASLALLGVFLFSLVAALLIAYSRSPLHDTYATAAGRYAPVTAVGLCAVAILVLRRLNRAWTALCLACLFLLWLESFPYGVIGALGSHRFLSKGEACVRMYRIASDDCLGKLYFNEGPYVREQARTLERLGYLPQFDTGSILWREEPPAGGSLLAVRLSGSVIKAEGMAVPTVCGRDTAILLTAGKEQRVIGATVAMTRYPHELNLPGQPCNVGDWDVVLDNGRMKDVPLGDVRAWVYDAEQRTAAPLPRG